MLSNILLFLITAILSTHAVNGQTIAVKQGQRSYPLWKSIQAGPYNVGFRTINWKDMTRSVVTEGAKPEESGPGFLPVQISVWYPTSERWTCEKAMPFKEYFYLTEQKNDFREPSQERKDKALEIFHNFAKFGLSIDLESAELKEISNTCTSTIKDAKPTRQKHPVILAGHDGGIWKMSTLSEYLASHGYVVFSSGFLSSTFSLMSKDPQKALTRRTGTFEIVRGLLNQIESADPSRIGLLGLNADGMSVLLYQMKTKATKAVVSIDGWEGKNGGSRTVSENQHFALKGFDAPYLEFQQDDQTDREPLQLNTTIFDQMTGSDRFSFVLKDFGHAYLTGNMIALPKLDEPAISQHRFWFGTIRLFMDAYVRSDARARKSLWHGDMGTALDEKLLRKDRRVRGKD